MRIIEQDLIDAIKAKQNKVLNNTMVQVDGEGNTSIYLHGNLIALIDKDYVHLSSCGWRTPTTKGCLNRVLEAVGVSKSIYQKAGAWYVGGRYTVDEPIEFYDDMKFSYNS